MTLEELSKYEQWQADEQVGKGLIPCPFCGAKLADMPFFMVIPPVRSERYLLAKLFKKDFLGSDNGFVVTCITCGSQGARGMTRQEAVDKWNRRAENVDLKSSSNN